MLLLHWAESTLWAIKTFPCGGTTTIGGGTAMSGGATPNVVTSGLFRPVPTEFNQSVYHPSHVEPTNAGV